MLTPLVVTESEYQQTTSRGMRTMVVTLGTKVTDLVKFCPGAVIVTLAANCEDKKSSAVSLL